MDLAAGVSTALPSAASIQDVADAVNGSRPDLHDVVSFLLVAMRAATMNATSPVVWPGCAVATPAASAFQQPKAGRVKTKPVQPIVRESSSGEDSGWSSARASRPPRSHLHWRAMAGHGSKPSATRAGLVAGEANRALVQTGVSPGSTALGRVLLPGNK
ncbi:unnamed protein product [Ectocarpus sp. CCAP 1310/34]|nr:unnamed protein product [Ectocarpus sp. CCAP 1310/34]